ncbi:MAG TPA: DNA gyrase inhibitor YacG [Burkholderiales bacterium]|nr:DNA gyrase inhibitor YacG [Burkholderiales bacterium]
MKKVPCPRCGTRTPYGPQNRWRPFCSERCRMIDLGDWACERYSVPGEEPGTDDAGNGTEDDAGG